MKDSVWNHNPEKFLKECKRLRALCLRIINGVEPVIEGSRKMLLYLFRMKEQNNKLWNVFRAVDSESHHLPIGSARQYWAKDSLEKKDEEIKALGDFYRDAVIDAARQIRDEYSKHVEQ